MNDKNIGYFPHDLNAHDDDKIEALIQKYGMEGYGRYWVIVEKMRSEIGLKLKKKGYVFSSLAQKFKCSADEVKKFIQDCIEEFELFDEEDSLFYSNSLIRRMSNLKAMAARRKAGAYAMHEKYKHNITDDGKEPEL